MKVEQLREIDYMGVWKSLFGLMEVAYDLSKLF